jgi:hypothetical protein
VPCLQGRVSPTPINRPILRDRCRKAGARARANSVPQTQKPGLQASVTLIPQQIRASETLPEGIVPDAKWPGMYGLRPPDGSLSVMVNLTRAKDALAYVRQDEPGETQRAAGPKRTPGGTFPLTKRPAGL